MRLGSEHYCVIVVNTIDHILHVQLLHTVERYYAPMSGLLGVENTTSGSTFEIILVQILLINP